MRFDPRVRYQKPKPGAWRLVGVMSQSTLGNLVISRPRGASSAPSKSFQSLSTNKQEVTVISRRCLEPPAWRGWRCLSPLLLTLLPAHSTPGSTVSIHGDFSKVYTLQSLQTDTRLKQPAWKSQNLALLGGANIRGTR